jgi:glycolate oxidase
VRLVRRPQAWKTYLAVFESVADASLAVSDIIRGGIVPAALEMMDREIVNAVEAAYHFGFPLDAGAVLIVELDGLAAGLETQGADVVALCDRHRAREVRVARTDEERLALWKCRKRAFGAVGRLSPAFLTQDGVVPRSKLPEIMAFIIECTQTYGLRIANVFHAGDGNIHPIVLYDERDPDQVRRAVHAGEAILSRCLDLGGSVSGEHGIGVEKIDFMARQFSPDDLEAMQQLRRVFDPDGRCNPHKIFPGSKRCGDFQPRKRASA